MIHSLNCMFSGHLIQNAVLKLTFSESVSLSLKTRLMTLLMMTLLNMPQETPNVHRVITFINGISLEEKVLMNKLSIQ